MLHYHGLLHCPALNQSILSMAHQFSMRLCFALKIDILHYPQSGVIVGTNEPVKQSPISVFNG